LIQAWTALFDSGDRNAIRRHNQTHVRSCLDFVGAMGYNFDQTFDRTTVRPKPTTESPMSTATLSREATRPNALTSGYAGFAEPVRLAPERPILPPAPPRARLTRRGRLVLFILAVGLLLAAISLGRAGSQAATATETGPALQQTTVQQGETLWTVAQRIAPDNDPRDVVAQIRRINHLHSSSLRVGQQLLLPVPSR
jgi:hypothetical protein